VIALALAAALAAPGVAPGCPGALAAMEAMSDAALPRAAPAILARLEADPALAPAAALREAADALRAEGVPGASRFRAALATHCALAGRPALPTASPGERALLAAVLADPAYRRARLDPGALRRRLLALWAWVLDALGTAQAERYADLGRTLFLAAAAFGLAALAWAARRRIAAAPRGAPAPSPPGRAPDADLGPAEAAAARGDGAGAIRLALRAALGALERDGVAPPFQALTNGELVARVRAARHPGDAELGALVAAFDRAVYGARAVSAGDARAALEAARRLGARVEAR
jgi:hypothetical protein